MLPGKRDFYRCCKARHSASQVNKLWQQFQNYAPPSLRVIRTKFARTGFGTGFGKTGLIAGYVKIDFILEKASTKFKYCLRKI